MQRGGLLLKAHRCIVAYGFPVFLIFASISAKAEAERSLEDFAEININQYFTGLSTNVSIK